VPTTAGRRVGIIIVLVLLLGAAALALLPFGAGAVRVGRLSVVWWYAAAVAPIIAVLVTIAVSLRQRPRPDGGVSPATPE
jgi:membrane protein implicated in regulation of membrane protease activity